MKEMLVRYMAIGVAGSAGALARFVIGSLFGQLNVRFPVGTLFINLTGSLFLGWFITHAATRGMSDTTRLAIGVGFVGAYTTFSTYMYESYKLLHEGAAIEAAVNLVGSLALGLAAVWVGVWLARWI